MALPPDYLDPYAKRVTPPTLPRVPKTLRDPIKGGTMSPVVAVREALKGGNEGAPEWAAPIPSYTPTAPAAAQVAPTPAAPTTPTPDTLGALETGSDAWKQAAGYWKAQSEAKQAAGVGTSTVHAYDPKDFIDRGAGGASTSYTPNEYATGGGQEKPFSFVEQLQKQQSRGYFDNPAMNEPQGGGGLRTGTTMQDFANSIIETKRAGRAQTEAARESAALQRLGITESGLDRRGARSEAAALQRLGIESGLRRELAGEERASRKELAGEERLSRRELAGEERAFKQGLAAEERAATEPYRTAQTGLVRAQTRKAELDQQAAEELRKLEGTSTAGMTDEQKANLAARRRVLEGRAYPKTIDPSALPQ